MRWLVNFCCELATFYIPILLWQNPKCNIFVRIVDVQIYLKILIRLLMSRLIFLKKKLFKNNILILNSTAQDKCILHYIHLKGPLAKGLQVSWTAGLNVFLTNTPPA